MNDRKNASWMLVLCVTMSPLAGCDEVADPTDTVQELQPVELGMWPLAVGEDVWSPASAAVPVKAIYPEKHLSPTEDLMIGWLNWALGQSYADGPISDPTGANCAVGQDGPVWYLAGTWGGEAVRECDIPAGKQLFFPLINRWCVFPPEYYASQESIDEVLPLIDAWYDGKHASTCELTLRIDGQDLRPDFASLDEDTYIEVMDLFELDLHDQHWAEGYFAGGPMPATGAGHYALIQPLTPGDHVVELGGSLCGQYPFSVNVTYLLHVGA